MAHQARARSVAPLMHLDLESPIRNCELESARILGVEQVAVRLADRSRNMEFDIGLGIVIMVQDVAVQCEKYVEGLRIDGRQIGGKGLMGNNAALPPL